MKEYRIMILLVSTLFTIAMSCSSQLDNEDFSDMIGKGQKYTPPPVPVEEPTLKDKEGWKIDSIDGKSFIWYSYNKSAFNARQQVNVLEIDLSSPDYELEFVSAPQLDSLSSVALKHDAVAGINGTYELEASFVKVNGLNDRFKGAALDNRSNDFERHPVDVNDRTDGIRTSE